MSCSCVLSALQVATQRVKTAQKAEIPHIDEPVSKIENVGVQTQNKLQDIKAAAEQIGVHGLNVVHNCITTGQSAALSILVPCSVLLPCLARHTFPEEQTLRCQKIAQNV